MYVVESDFEYKGYRCVTIFGHMGWRCGYVGLPKEHPLYRKNCGDILDITFEQMKDTYQEKRGILPWVFSCTKNMEDKVTLDFYFNVHGSITYSNGEKDYPVESDLWWLGFDCGHAGDKRDLDKILEIWGDDPHIRQKVYIDKQYLYDDDYEIRDLEYVKQECRNLVDQIIEYIGG